MRFCTACGTPVSGTRSYCTHCGAAIRRPADPDLAAAPVGAAHGDQAQPVPGPAAGPGTVPGPLPALAAAEPGRPGSASPVSASPGSASPVSASPVPASLMPASPMPASPEPARAARPSTWLADFDQRPEPPADSRPPPLPATPTAPATGRTLLAVAVLAVLIAVGSAAWMAGSSGPRAARLPAAASGVSPSPAQHPARTAGSTAPRPARSTLTPIPSSRQGIVSVSRALAQRADAQQVAGFLDSYFAAVNHREYLEYSSLFERWHHLTRAEFDRGYRTTHDSSALLVGLSSSHDMLTATVTFTSHQNPSASPNHASCTNWRIVLYLRRVGDVYLIGPPPSGYHATYHSCG